jgi:predicted ribosomally synthesized peptide with nif11-like leader
MSDVAVKEFNARMAADETFSAKVRALKNINERMKLINSEGFDCTAEEITAAFTELSEDELAMVAGGVPILNLTFD